jgi:hypothetical protein
MASSNKEREMGETRWTKNDAEKVYRQYLTDPAAGKSKYLHDHFRHGLAGMAEPLKSQVLAHAAWRAGREAARRQAE